MSAAVSPVPRLTFFANDGTPLNGGLIYTYAAGTLTPKATYSDEALTVPISNPIVCNSAGRPVASATDPTEVNVYLLPASYKFICKTSLGVTLWTADNIEAVATAIIGFPVTVTGGTSGGVPYFSSTTTLASSALLTASDVILGGGSGNPPVSQGVKAANTFLAGPTSGASAIMTARVLDPQDLESTFATVTSQFDATTATLANVPGLSLTLVAGKTYHIHGLLNTTIDATGGIKVAFGGTATATTFAGTATVVSGVANTTLGNHVTSITTILDAAVGGTINIIHFTAYIVVNAGGTLTIQFAQHASPNNTSSVLVGSFMQGM